MQGRKGDRCPTNLCGHLPGLYAGRLTSGSGATSITHHDCVVTVGVEDPDEPRGHVVAWDTKIIATPSVDDDDVGCGRFQRVSRVNILQATFGGLSFVPVPVASDDVGPLLYSSSRLAQHAGVVDDGF